MTIGIVPHSAFHLVCSSSFDKENNNVDNDSYRPIVTAYKSTLEKKTLKIMDTTFNGIVLLISVINRPLVAGAVLEIPSLLND